MQAPIAAPSNLSLEEFLKLPETEPASEYIDGRICQKPMPQGKHSRFQTRLSAAINEVIEPTQTGCAFTELRCTFGKRSIIPDIAVFEWNRIPLNAQGEVENIFPIHPDWTVEILSPDQRPIRVINNILFCLNQGTQLGWLIAPEEKTVIIFQPNQQPIAKEVDSELLPVPELLGDWQLTLGDLLAWLSFAKS